MTKKQTYITWAAQIVAAAILAMAMFPKFTGDPQAINTFTILGVEPWGRYLTATLELIAAILLLVPQLKKHAMGGLVATGLMIGALGSHVLKLGFAGEIGSMAAMAAVVLIASLVVLYLRRSELPIKMGS